MNATDKELLDALAVLVAIKQQDKGAEVVLSPAEAKHLLDIARLALRTEHRVTLDDAQRRTLVAACINALPIAHGGAKLTDLISILSGTDTTVVVHRAYPPRRFTEEQKP